MWWNSSIENHRQKLTRRAFVSGLTGARLLLAQDRPADITLSIEPAQIDVASGHIITTATYNGTAPGPVIRMREGIPATVEIFNHTGVPEYVHWHGFEIPAELDGTQEEGSLAVPAGGRLRYEITPLQFLEDDRIHLGSSNLLIGQPFHSATPRSLDWASLRRSVEKKRGVAAVFSVPF